MSKLPKVSIIIPCYNYEKYICDAILSCKCQDYEGKIETIIVDDCSRDSSLDRIRSMFDPSDYTLVRHRKNLGYSVAKNSGIRESSGSLIVLLDADDMLTPGSIKTRVNAIVSNDADMVYGKSFIIADCGGYDYYVERMYKLCVHNGKKIHAQTTMLRREVHLKYGLYDETLRSRSDNEMWNRLGLYSKSPKIKAVMIDDQPLAFYRRHDLSMIEYRKRHPRYNYDVSKALEDAKQMRQIYGISKETTPWLNR